MFRNLNRLTPALVLPFVDKRNRYDRIPTHQQEPTTGIERVEKMFSPNELHEQSAELVNVIQASLTGLFSGACYGGFLESRKAYVNFIEQNQATIFKTTMDAKKKLQNHVTVAFAKGAYHWGWRIGLFTGIFSFISTTISVYRGKTSFIEYTIAGAITGALYKVNLGLAATLVGAGLGAALSTVGGLTILAILKVSGISMDDIRIALAKLKEEREQQFKEVMDKASTEMHDDVTRHHDDLIKDMGEKKIEEI